MIAMPSDTKVAIVLSGCLLLAVLAVWWHTQRTQAGNGPRLPHEMTASPEAEETIAGIPISQIFPGS